MYPVTFEMAYIERRSRLSTFFRGILAIPHFLFLLVYTIGADIALVGAWFALLFTARWPVGLHSFMSGFLRYSARLSAYLYLGVDQYPPFSGAEDDSYPVQLQIEPPLQRYSRPKVFFRGIYAILAMVIRYAMTIVLGFTGLLSCFAILFTGRQPASLQNALKFALTYVIQADALLLLLTETYPPLGEAPAATPAAGVT
jgi:Domain of unknown function (DUF4389)